jgi:hypothetical protein
VSRKFAVHVEMALAGLEQAREKHPDLSVWVGVRGPIPAKSGSLQHRELPVEFGLFEDHAESQQVPRLNRESRYSDGLHGSRPYLIAKRS